MEDLLFLDANLQAWTAETWWKGNAGFGNIGPRLTADVLDQAPEEATAVEIRSKSNPIYSLVSATSWEVEYATAVGTDTPHTIPLL